jgi:hypothetical protein
MPRAPGRRNHHEPHPAYCLGRTCRLLLEKEQQTDIVRRVNRLKPIITACGGAVGVMTASVVGIYVWNAWKSLQ